MAGWRTDSNPTLAVRDLGRLGYAAALAIQREANAAVAARRAPPTLLLVEHDPVITVSHRRGAAGHLRASAERLDALGIAVHETDRGGDITYHGPGQLVAYPILRLGDLGLNLGRYMRRLEAWVIETVAAFGVEAERVEGCTGVWVDSRVPCCGSRVPEDVTPATCRTADPGTRNPTLAKLCALGVRVRKNTTMHGLALNVTTDLSHFETIVPCGLDKPVTSLASVLGAACPPMERVKAALARVIADDVASAGMAAPAER